MCSNVKELPQSAKADSSLKEGATLSDREPASYILAEVTNGRQPEAEYLAALLKNIGYDVLWEGLRTCVTDFQQKKGLAADGIAGKSTWDKLSEAER